jgi:hypothetical protein
VKVQVEHGFARSTRTGDEDTDRRLQGSGHASSLDATILEFQEMPFLGCK